MRGVNVTGLCDASEPRGCEDVDAATGRVGANRRRPSDSGTWRGEARRGVRRAQEREAEARGWGGGAGAERREGTGRRQHGIGGG